MLVDRSTLDELGALGPDRGSSTISAVSALFLASRYVTDPQHGVVEAAFSSGADTDTLASMTAALLAMVNEGSTLLTHAMGVQNAEYLSSLAEKGWNLELESRTVVNKPLTNTQVTK